MTLVIQWTIVRLIWRHFELLFNKNVLIFNQNIYIFNPLSEYPLEADSDKDEYLDLGFD